jgi:hypothetical protein
MPDRWQHRGPANSRPLMGLFRDPRLWTALLAYGYVKVAARLRARRRLRQMEGRRDAQPAHVWERDETSRQPAAR